MKAYALPRATPSWFDKLTMKAISALVFAATYTITLTWIGLSETEIR